MGIKRPWGQIDTNSKKIEELEYLVMRICDSLKIKHRYEER